MEITPSLQYIQSKGWKYRQSGNDQVELEICPFCKKSDYGHFYIVISNSARDGVFQCHRCGEGGNLTTLRERMGDKRPDVTPLNVGKTKEIEEMPDIEAAHQELLEDADALDYLINFRGFSRQIIEKQKLGVSKRWFRECGEVKALLYPYLVDGNCVFVHWRTLPPSQKAFSSLKGWDAPLYNGEILRDGIKEITAVEGEANTICALDNGIEDVVGVPGANFKKAMWIDELDKLGIEKVYVCYDKDKVGQKAAQTLASRVGIERCYKIILPDFTVPTDEGTKPGKDLNEWFKFGGGTKEAFEKLKEEAQLFDIQGVKSSKDALSDLEDEINGKGTLKPTYDTPWEPLNKYVGFEDGDVIDILAPEKIGKTTFGMNLMEYEVDKTGEDGIIICLEMPIARMVRKYVSHKAQVDISIPKNEEQDRLQVAALKEAIPRVREMVANRKGTLYFCLPVIRDVEDAYKLMIDCIRRYGVKWIMFDNIQKLCDITLKGSDRTIHLSKISKRFDAIAKEYGIKLIRILQPHRIQKGQVITTDNTDGSSQIAKDCDCTMTLWRKSLQDLSIADYEEMGFVDEENAFESKMLVTVGLSRYSSGGRVNLEFDGKVNTVFEYDEAMKAKFLGQRPQVTGYTLPTETKICQPVQFPEEKVTL